MIAYSAFNIAITYYNQGLLDYSIKAFYRYLEIQKGNNNTKGIAYAYVNLGAILTNLEQFDRSKEYFEKALETFEKLANKENNGLTGSEVISIFNNLGIVSKSLHDTVTAIKYYSQGIALAKHKQGQETYLANLLNNLGSLYLDLGKTNEAFEYLKDALNIRIQINDNTGLVNSYRMLAAYHSKLNDKEKALDFLYKGLKLANDIGSLAHKSTMINKIFNHFYEKKQADSALKYRILLSEIEEKVNAEVFKKELAMLELTSQIQEKEKIRQLEQKRKELKYLLVGLALVLLISVMTFLYLLSLSRVRRLRLAKENIDLISKNLELEKSNLMQELELKSKELTTNVMYQIQKNELIHEIGQKLQKLSFSISKNDQKPIIDIIKDLEKTQDSNIWNEFELRFQQVHNEFYNKLNEINPDLSPNDRRLCAFLRLNMTTKEICSVTGQSIRSIEVARTRLRRKLNLTNSETGLIEYLAKL